MTYSGKSTAAYTYSYDVRGNITEVRKNGSVVASYAYDDLNQLIRENNVTANKTWVYTYDERGNILSKKTYAYTTGTLGAVEDSQPYWYYDQWSTEAWGDVLRAYDYSPYFSYDSIGNPLVYIRDGSLFNFTWQNGRQLASGTKGTTEFAYTYNADGLRTKKVVNGVTTEYYWAGSQLAMMIVNPDLSTKKVLKFYYDAEGIPMCLDYNGTVYYYITNLQGDVVALADQYGEVIRYEYDAWGKPISTYYIASPYYDAMQYNPLRYRGYIYDNETGFYYLQSRYYDPVVGRFINADELIHNGFEFLGTNTYAYCINNPVNMVDITGNTPEYINDQSGPIEGKEGNNISFFFGNIGDHGCGVVAAYNILLSKSSKIKFDKVKKDILWKYNGSLLFGYLGTNPISLANYMKSKFWFVSVSGPNTWLWGIKAELSEAVIVLIKWEDGTMHYIAGISTGSGWVSGSFRFYNSGLDMKNGNSIDGKKLSMRAFLHYVESNGATPIMMISVSGKKGWW